MAPPLPDNSARLKLILHGLFLISGVLGPREVAEFLAAHGI